MALVMVLGAITVLTVFLTELQEQTSSELSAALAERDSVKAEYYARSAVNLSRLLIRIEANIRSSIPFLQMLGIKQLPVWKYQDMVLGPFNGASEGQSFTSAINADPATGKNLGISGGGHFELSIVDEDSKINLNNAASGLATSADPVGRQLLGLMANPEYNTMFEGRDADNQFSDRQIICGAIVDWIDSSTSGAEELYACDPNNSNNTSSRGAEDSFYESLGLGYRRKNAPLDSLSELRLVRGVSDDFWSTFIDPDPSNPDKRNITVWGQGKINLNTANAQTILAVVCGDPTAALFCSDATQLLPFIQIVSMANALLPPGVPLFGSPKELTNFLATGGQTAQAGAGAPAAPGAPSGGISTMVLGMLSSMTGAQLKPIPGLNKGNIEKQFTNTSHIFSIYADGVVPGYRKTTKVRIHAVVDFKDLSKPLDSNSLIFSGVAGAGGTQPGGAGAPGQPQPNNAGAGTMPAGAYAAMVQADPAGNVLYWRVE